MLSKNAYLISAVLLIDDRKLSKRDLLTHVKWFSLAHIRYYANIKKGFKNGASKDEMYNLEQFKKV